MTVYTKSMMEALAEVRGLQEDNMDLMRKAAGGAMQTIKMKDGKLQMWKIKNAYPPIIGGNKR